MSERFMPVIDVSDDWVIIEVVPGVTRSVHAEDLTQEQLDWARLELTSQKYRKLRRLRDGS